MSFIEVVARQGADRLGGASFREEAYRAVAFQVVAVPRAYPASAYRPCLPSRVEAFLCLPCQEAFQEAAYQEAAYQGVHRVEACQGAFPGEEHRDVGASSQEEACQEAFLVVERQGEVRQDTVWEQQTLHGRRVPSVMGRVLPLL